MQSVNNNQSVNNDQATGSKKDTTNPYDRFNKENNSIQAKFSTMFNNIRSKFSSSLSNRDGESQTQFRNVVQKMNDQNLTTSAKAVEERNKLMDQKEEDEKRARREEIRKEEIREDLDRKDANAALALTEANALQDLNKLMNQQLDNERDDENSKEDEELQASNEKSKMRPSDILAASFAAQGVSFNGAPTLNNTGDASSGGNAQSGSYSSGSSTNNALQTLMAASGGNGVSSGGSTHANSNLTKEGHGTNTENNASKAYEKMASVEGANTDKSIGTKLDDINRHNLSTVGEGESSDELDRISGLGNRELRANLDSLARSSNVSKLSIDMSNPNTLATAARNAQSINNLTHGVLQNPVVGGAPNGNAGATVSGNTNTSASSTLLSNANSINAANGRAGAASGGATTGATNTNTQAAEDAVETATNNAQRALDAANARGDRNAAINNKDIGISGNTASNNTSGVTNNGATNGAGSTNGAGDTTDGTNNVANNDTTTSPEGDDGVDLRPNEQKHNAQENSLKAMNNAEDSSDKAVDNASSASSKALANSHHTEGNRAPSTGNGGATNNGSTSGGSSSGNTDVVDPTEDVTNNNARTASYSDPDADELETAARSGSTSAREALMKLAGISSDMSSEELVAQARANVAEFNARHNLMSDRAITQSPEVANAISSLQSTIKNSDRFGGYAEDTYSGFNDHAVENAASVVTKNTFNSLMSGNDDNHGTSHDESASLFAQGNSTNALSELRSAQYSMNSFAHMAMTTSAAQNAEQIHERVMQMAARNMKQLNVELSPNEMGKMRISINLDKENQAVTVSLAAASPETRQALEQAMPRLRDALAQQNVEADTNIYDLNDQNTGHEQGQHAGTDSGSQSGSSFGNSNSNLNSLGLPTNRPLRASDLAKASGDSMDVSAQALSNARNIGHAFGVDGAVSNNAFKNSREDSLNGLKSTFGERGTVFAHGTMSDAVADNLTDGNKIS